VERAVRCRGAEDARDGLDAAAGGGRRRLDHDGRGPHPQDHAVPPEIEGHGCVRDDIVRCRGSRGEEPGTDPVEQSIARDIVTRDDHDAFATIGSDPVLGQRNRLCGAGARRVDLGVRSAGADVLGELGVTHRQGVEQELPIELVRVLLLLDLQGVDPMVELFTQQLAASELRDTGADGLEVAEAFLPGAVLVVAPELSNERVQAGEGGGEDHPGGVSVRIGQHPPLGQLPARRRRLVMHHQRYPGIAEGVEPGADGEHARDVERLRPLGGKAEVIDEVDDARPPGELDDIGLARDRFEAAATFLRLDEPGDVLVDDLLALLHGYRVDELLAPQNGRNLVVAEHPLAAWQAEAGTGDHHRRVWRGFAGCESEDLGALREEFREEVAELLVSLGAETHWLDLRAVHGTGRGQRRLGRSAIREASCAIAVRGRPEAKAGGVQPAERLIESDDVPLLGMVGEQGEDLRVVTQHLLHEAVERALGADLDEHSAPRVVKGAEALDELHRRGDLPTEDVNHLIEDVGTHRVEGAVDVGHQRYRG
jgi:hypothetical protein